MRRSSANPDPDIADRTYLDELPPDEAQHHDDGLARDRRIEKLRLLWDSRRFLIRLTGYGLLAATLIAFLIPKQYESTARLMPPDNNQSSGSMMASGMAMLAAITGKGGGGGAAAGLATDLLGLKTSSAVFIGILRSRTVSSRLVDRFDLRKVYGIRRMEDACKRLEGNTEVAEDRKSGIIVITVTDKDPHRAAGLAQAYVEELDRLVRQLTTSAAHREREFLESRLVTVKQDLEAAEKDFSSFASKNSAIDIKEQGKAMVEAAAVLQGQLIAAQSELEGLKQIYTDNNVRVRSVRARIAELQKQLGKMGGADLNGSESGTETDDSLYPSIRKLPLLGVPYADLYRRTKIQETVFELLTQQYESAKVQEAKETPTVKLLDAANIPEKKAFPPRLAIMVAGMLLSLCGAAGWVLVSRHWKQVDDADPGKQLATEVLGTLKANVASASRNGSRLRAAFSKVASRNGNEKAAADIADSDTHEGVA